MLFFIIFILLCAVQFLFITNLKKSHKTADFLHIPHKNKHVISIICIISIIILYIVLFISVIETQKVRTDPTLLKGLKNAKYTYTILGKKNIGTSGDVYILYDEKDKAMKAINSMARNLKKNICKELCTLHVYDDKNAYVLDLQRLLITATADMELWNRKNYVFVANHYLGYVSTKDTFAYYPYKDWYYYAVQVKRN